MIRFRTFPILAAALLAGSAISLAQGSDPIGLNALRSFDPTLTGSDIIVAQPEALYTGTDGFEVNPATTGQPAGKFYYTGEYGAVANGAFPNSAGSESSHADSVGDNFYGQTNITDPEGVAPAIAAVYNYEADYFINTVVNDSVAIPPGIVNQSFIATTSDNAEQEEIEEIYDNYTAIHNTLFISGAGNGGQVYAPASSYNGIGVGAFGGGSSTGPTYDGRSKPDITAPAGETSYSTPLVAGAAAILLQAVERGDAGTGTEISGSSPIIIKALLLNGAVKPSGWNHTAAAPLDPQYGAGILNTYYSYMNLRAGEYSDSGETAGAAGSVDSGAIVPDEGWDLATITTSHSGSSYTSESYHYLFDFSANTNQSLTLTATLTWLRHRSQTAINNLDLYLFNATTGAAIVSSTSAIDNVQALYVQNLAPGRYDLVVEKPGGTSVNNGGSVVSASESYGLAFDFATAPIVTGTPATASISSSGVVLSGTVNPNGVDTTYYIQYGTTASYGILSATEDIGSGASPVSISSPLSCLQPLTTYYYQLVVTSVAGTVYGPVETFTTSAQVPAMPPWGRPLLVLSMAALAYRALARRTRLRLNPDFYQ